MTDLARVTRQANRAAGNPITAIGNDPETTPPCIGRL